MFDTCVLLPFLVLASWRVRACPPVARPFVFSRSVFFVLQITRRAFSHTLFVCVSLPRACADLQFSNDGLTLLVLTQLGFAHLLNAFDGSVMHRLGSPDAITTGDIVTVRWDHI